MSYRVGRMVAAVGGILVLAAAFALGVMLGGAP